jgi:DNA (cytosine-5)-methyltransferase 1
MRELSLFSGAGGGLLGTKLLGWEHVGYVEFNEYCQKVIRQRIKDGILDEAPIFGDIRTFISEGYAESYTGLVDVVTAGFPCQPFSSAGKQLGEDDPRNMWPQTLDIIRRVRPRFAFLENVPGLLANKYIRRIFGDLAESGFDARWRVLSAAEMGAPHLRDRLWIVGINADSAYASGEREPIGENKDTTERQTKKNEQEGNGWKSELDSVDVAQRFDTYARALRILYEVPFLMERTRAIGNGQVPAVVARAWQSLTSDIDL